MRPFGLLDMDGVVADFALAASKLHGLPYPPTVWDWFKPHIDEVAFYAPMGEAFWRGLPPTEDAHELVALMRGRFGERLAFCTSPVRTAGCIRGKRAWAERYALPVIPYSQKHHLASPWHVLVDDNADAVERFRSAGGRAFLWPQPYNGGDLTNRVGQLADFLETL